MVHLVKEVTAADMVAEVLTQVAAADSVANAEEVGEVVVEEGLAEVVQSAQSSSKRTRLPESQTVSQTRTSTLSCLNFLLFVLLLVPLPPLLLGDPLKLSPKGPSGPAMVLLARP